MILLSPARRAGSARTYGAILTAPPDRQVMRYTEIRALPAHAEVLADERAPTAIAFLRRCVAFYAVRGVVVQAVIPGQWQRIPGSDLGDRLPPARPAPPPHPALQTPHKR